MQTPTLCLSFIMHTHKHTHTPHCGVKRVPTPAPTPASFSRCYRHNGDGWRGGKMDQGVDSVTMGAKRTRNLLMCYFSLLKDYSTSSSQWTALKPVPMSHSLTSGHRQNLTPLLGSTTSSLCVIVVYSGPSDTETVIMQVSAEHAWSLSALSCFALAQLCTFMLNSCQCTVPHRAMPLQELAHKCFAELNWLLGVLICSVKSCS